jgi:hypothetical protein
VVAPAGTGTVRLVALACVTPARVPLNFTMLSAVTGEKFVPTIVTLVPVVPVAGEKLVMDKLDAGVVLNVKLFVDVTSSLPTSTVILPVVPPTGAATVRLVVVAEVTGVTTPLNLTTLFAGVGEKFVPVKVTTVPSVPAVGEKPVRVNSSACGAGSLFSLPHEEMNRLRMAIAEIVFIVVVSGFGAG